MALDEKEKINIDKTQTEKYIESIKSSLDLLKNQLKDYIGEDYYFFLLDIFAIFLKIIYYVQFNNIKSN